MNIAQPHVVALGQLWTGVAGLTSTGDTWAQDSTGELKTARGRAALFSQTPVPLRLRRRRSMLGQVARPSGAQNTSSQRAGGLLRDVLQRMGHVWLWGAVLRCLSSE